MSSDRVIRITCDPQKQQDRVPLAELEDFQGDLKALSDAAEAELAANLVDLGYSYPTCVWHGHKAILDGHQRNKVLRRLLADGYVLLDVDDEPTESVPVTWVMADSEQQARKKVLAAVSQYGKLSDVGLRDFLGAADLEWPEVKPWVALPDFDVRAFERMMSGDGEDVPEPQEPPANPVTRLGDLWVMGEHRLLCGDSTDEVAVERVMGGMTPGTAIYDPPWDAENMVMSLPENVLAFTDGARARDVIDMFGSPAWVFGWDCVSSWYTPNRPLRRMKLAFWYGDIEAYQFDGAHFGVAGESRTVSNTRGEYTYNPDPRGKHLSDLFTAPITSFHQEAKHPHAKPLDWVRLLIGCCTAGEVFDPFVGEGTAMLAAEQLGRRCLALDIEPAYIDVSVLRWQEYTGESAILDGDGRTFAQVGEERTS